MAAATLVAAWRVAEAAQPCWSVRLSERSRRAGQRGGTTSAPHIIDRQTDRQTFKCCCGDVGGDRLSAADGERDRTPCSSACVGLAARTQRASTAPTRISQLEQKPLLATHRQAATTTHAPQPPAPCPLSTPLLSLCCMHGRCVGHTAPRVTRFCADFCYKVHFCVFC